MGEVFEWPEPEPWPEPEAVDWDLLRKMAIGLTVAILGGMAYGQLILEATT
jgi:hypothetical protein